MTTTFPFIAIDRHLIPRGLEPGDYDDHDSIFLDDRTVLILSAIKTPVIDAKAALLADIATKVRALFTSVAEK